MRFVQSGLFVFAGLVLLISVVRLFAELWDWHEAREIRQHSLDELKDLEVERDQLRVEIEKLKTDELAKERLARRLGYVKPGEVIYKIVDTRGRSTSAKHGVR